MGQLAHAARPGTAAICPARHNVAMPPLHELPSAHGSIPVRVEPSVSLPPIVANPGGAITALPDSATQYSALLPHSSCVALVLPGAHTKPARHGPLHCDCVKPLSLPKRPASQAAHASWPELGSEKKPLLQVMQPVLPTFSANEPGVQSVHTVRDVVLVKRPEGHCTHDDKPVTLLNEPALHGVDTPEAH
jgi:hypothetical protein